METATLFKYGKLGWRCLIGGRMKVYAENTRGDEKINMLQVICQT